MFEEARMLQSPSVEQIQHASGKQAIGDGAMQPAAGLEPASPTPTRPLPPGGNNGSEKKSMIKPTGMYWWMVDGIDGRAQIRQLGPVWHPAEPRRETTRGGHVGLSVMD